MREQHDEDSGTDLPSAEADHQVSDERILSLAAAMRHHRPPAIFLRQVATENAGSDSKHLKLHQTILPSQPSIATSK